MTGINVVTIETRQRKSHRNAASLAAKLEEVNAEKKLTRRVPSEKEEAKMIEAAKELEPKMSY